MPRYNENFELSVEDLDLIETALRQSKRDLAGRLVEADEADNEEIQQIDESVRRIHDLLGRLHNQKVFYRPQERPYIGG
ncbi:hypothetical protein SAMN05444398_101700 [Roseovarius pacificus]|uniref:Uncharacterized protein n=1 Tax=Roseovarius pacificus TaxID=337701 RepID=A0A1M6Y5Q3_9RHOB|nr:hypothetical protein [Roseovarius pacificus]GGO51340.1 hypothetical protein GCM10011315_04260 [Roseovarius pacificus]SHL13305.1 hypothetical protein SAMN05444398_101700 [Roseovarius pacificus]